MGPEGFGRVLVHAGKERTRRSHSSTDMACQGMEDVPESSLESFFLAPTNESDAFSARSPSPERSRQTAEATKRPKGKDGRAETFVFVAKRTTAATRQPNDAVRSAPVLNSVLLRFERVIFAMIVWACGQVAAVRAGLRGSAQSAVTVPSTVNHPLLKPVANGFYIKLCVSALPGSAIELIFLWGVGNLKISTSASGAWRTVSCLVHALLTPEKIQLPGQEN